jgi:hypothetical protein
MMPRDKSQMPFLATDTCHLASGAITAGLLNPAAAAPHRRVNVAFFCMNKSKMALMSVSTTPDSQASTQKRSAFTKINH